MALQPLTSAVTAGVLTGPDAWLLNAILVVRHPLPWAAGRLGISHENAKKRHQRAEARWKAWWLPDEPAPRRAA